MKSRNKIVTSVMAVGAAIALPLATAQAATPRAANTASQATVQSALNQDLPVSDSIAGYLAALPPGFQDKQVAIANFNTALGDLPQVHDAGYVASVDDVAAMTVFVYWHGSSPLIDQARDLAKQYGVTMALKPWRFDVANIEAASRRVMDASSKASLGNFEVNSVVGFNPDYQGLIVRGNVTGIAASDTDAVAAAISKTTSLAQAIAGIPVRIEQTSVTAAYGSRDQDSAPFRAGGMMYSPTAPTNDNICSSGFAVVISGVTSTTTARHCRWNDYEAINNTSAAYGTTRAWSDGGQGRVMTATGHYTSFDGAWDSVSFYKYVIGYATLGVGDGVCTDGANSGVHCGVTVSNLYVMWNDGYGSEPNIEASIGSGIAVIQGDSGGPVIVPSSDGTDVYAAGMIQFGAGTNYNPNCGSVYFVSGNGCYRTVGFTSMQTVVNNIPGGASLDTF